MEEKKSTLDDFAKSYIGNPFEITSPVHSITPKDIKDNFGNSFTIDSEPISVNLYKDIAGNYVHVDNLSDENNLIENEKNVNYTLNTTPQYAHIKNKPINFLKLDKGISYHAIDIDECHNVSAIPHKINNENKKLKNKKNIGIKIKPNWKAPKVFFNDDKISEEEYAESIEIDENGISLKKTFDNAEKIKKHLESKGIDQLYDIVVANGKTIQIDIDNEESFKTFERHYKILKEVIGEHSIEKRLSKSSKLHIYIHLQQQASIMRRIAIQALLGSDLTRETMNLKNFLQGNKNPILFIEPKESKGAK